MLDRRLRPPLTEVVLRRRQRRATAEATAAEPQDQAMEVVTRGLLLLEAVISVQLNRLESSRSAQATEREHLPLSA